MDIFSILSFLGSIMLIPKINMYNNTNISMRGEYAYL